MQTDKVDARVLAERARSDLVPELWVQPLRSEGKVPDGIENHPPVH